MLIFLIFNVHSYKTNTFLALQPEEAHSPSEVLATGIHNSDISLQSLSSQLTNSLQALGLKLDNSLKATSSSILSLLNSEIEAKQSSLSTINSEIHYLLRNSKNIYENCSGFRTCEACSYNPLCVWCDVEQICVGGDADGSFHGECSYFSYQSCFVNGCKGHNRCSSCVQSMSCGWCANQNMCMENVDNCESLPFVSFNAPGTHCTENEVVYPEVYINGNPTGSKDSVDEMSQRRVIELREMGSKIVQEIQNLEYAKAKLVGEVEQNLGLLVPDIEVGDLNEDLVHKVGRAEKIEDEKASKELESNLQQVDSHKDEVKATY